MILYCIYIYILLIYILYIQNPPIKTRKGRFLSTSVVYELAILGGHGARTSTASAGVFSKEDVGVVGL